MDPVVVGILGTIAGGVLGAGGQMVQAWRERAWQQRRLSQEAAISRRDRLDAARHATYANFGVQAGRYVNLLSKLAGHPGDDAPEGPELDALRSEERERHATLVAAQWELRMIASPAMLDAAERLATAAERVRDHCGSGGEFRAAWERHWRPTRDDYIATARVDFDVDRR